jgi:hypothetical protein
VCTPRAQQLAHIHLSPPSAPHPAAYYAGLLASLARECHTRHPFDASPPGAHPSRPCSALQARVLRLGLPLVGCFGKGLVDLYARSDRLGYAWRAMDCIEAWASGVAASSVLSCHAWSGFFMTSSMHFGASGGWTNLALPSSCPRVQGWTSSTTAIKAKLVLFLGINSGNSR